MTKFERVLRDLSEMHKFYREIEKIKQANAEKLGQRPVKKAVETAKPGHGDSPFNSSHPGSD